MNFRADMGQEAKRTSQEMYTQRNKCGLIAYTFLFRERDVLVNLVSLANTKKIKGLTFMVHWYSIQRNTREPMR